MVQNAAPPRGFVAYQGPSLLDGGPIVVIVLTGRSSNRKTGGMRQTYILRADIDPISAIRSGDDRSICGSCRHRGDGETGAGRSCYVTLFHGPRVVWDAYRRGIYPVATPERIGRALAGRSVRLGTYGDPAAAPVGLWRTLLSQARHWTGYTHAWRLSRVRGFAEFLMASCDTPAEASAARAAGWRTYRVSASVDPLAGVEITCPASDEAGKRTTCDRCGLCAGSFSSAKSITIRAHGGAAGNFSRALAGAV